MRPQGSEIRDPVAARLEQLLVALFTARGAGLGRDAQGLVLRIELLLERSDPDERPRAQQQLEPLDRLGEQVVRSRILGLRVDGQLVQRGEKHDRHAGAAGERTDAPAGLEPVDPRHHDVEQDEIDVVRLELLECLLAVGRVVDGEARRLEVAAGDGAVACVVVDDEHHARVAGDHAVLVLSRPCANVNSSDRCSFAASIGLLM